MSSPEPKSMGRPGQGALASRLKRGPLGRGRHRSFVEGGDSAAERGVLDRADTSDFRISD